MTAPIGPYLALSVTAAAPPTLYGPGGEQLSFNSTVGGDRIGSAWEIWSRTVDDVDRMAALISLATDRQAEPDDRLPVGELDRRGWWADAFGDEKIGSRLWLLEAETASEESARRAAEYVEESLAWMVADGRADAIEVETGKGPDGRVTIRVELVKGAERVTVLDAADLWGFLNG